jgi:hypothetical protein
MIFGFRSDIWVSWQCWLIWVLWCMNSWAISGRGKECTQTFISLASAVPEPNALRSAVRNFLWLLWTESSYLCLSSTKNFSLFLFSAVMCNRLGTSDAWITESECVLNYITVHLTVMAVRRKCYRPRRHRPGVRFVLWCAFIGRLKTFLFRMTVTLTMTQIKWPTQTSHSRLTIQTVDQLYL